MLRVEVSNLSSTKQTQRVRARRLHPTLPSQARRNITPSRHELLPPPGVTSAVEPASRLAQPSAPAVAPDRWNVRLQLQEAELARLYGQGLARGALVWRQGMPEWRPLLDTPELSRLLHRTPIAIHENVELDEDEVTLPRPARLPSGVAPSAPAQQPDSEAPRAPSSVAPTAFDVERPTLGRGRHRVELGAALVLGFAAAWLMPASPSATHRAEAAAAAPPAPTVVAPPAAPPQPIPSLLASIPTVAVGDLPLLGAGAPAHDAPAPTRRHASRSSSGGAPSRSDLVGALARVASAASSCGDRGGPVRVVIGFAKSGVARSIQVSGSDLPASTRSCIIGAASRARVPAFSGNPVTVSKTL